MSILGPGSSIGSYQFVKHIGSGSFADVWLAIHQKTGKKVAIKLISKEKFKDERHFTRFNREVSFMRQVEHPLISQLFQVLENDDTSFLVMEYCKGTSLVQYINEDGKMDEPTARQYFTQLISIIEYLHNEKKIIHRDLKAENILLDKNYNIRLIDFGLSNSFSKEHQDLTTACGSPGYLPPEMINGLTHTVSADIWSLGVVLYAMTVGKLPFEEPIINDVLEKIVKKEPYYPRYMTKELNSLLKRMLEKDSEKRITISGIKSHPWFNVDVYDNLKARLPRTLPSLSQQQQVIPDFVLNETVIKKMKKFGYDIDSILNRLKTRDFDEESAVYLMFLKSVFANDIRDIRDVGIRIEKESVKKNWVGKSPSYGVLNGSLRRTSTNPLVPPKALSRTRTPSYNALSSFPN